MTRIENIVDVVMGFMSNTVKCKQKNKIKLHQNLPSLSLSFSLSHLLSDLPFDFLALGLERFFAGSVLEEPFIKKKNIVIE